MASCKISAFILLCFVAHAALCSSVIYRLSARDLSYDMSAPSSFVQIYENGTQRWNSGQVDYDYDPSWPGVFEIENNYSATILAFEVRNNNSIPSVIGWSYLQASVLNNTGIFSTVIGLDGRSQGTLTVTVVSVTP